MADRQLTQQEAARLLAVEKHRADDTTYEYPRSGGRVAIPLVSADGRDEFLLDINRGSISLIKVSYQTRWRQIHGLVRLCLNGAPHRNPPDLGGERVDCPHLHVYREGYGLRYAAPVTDEDFPNVADLWAAFEDFLAFCVVSRKPYVQSSMI